MISMHRIGGWAAVFMALTMVAAALTPGALDQRKREVARASLERLGRADAETLVESASRAEALTDIHVDGSEAQVVLTVEITGQPACKTFTTEDGKKIVLDIEGAVNLQAGHVFAPATQAIVQQVRSSLFAVEPQYVSRVVADLTGPGRYVMDRGDGHIRVTITKGQAKPPTQPVLETKNPERVNKTKATLEAVRKEVQESGSRVGWLGNGVSRVGAAARTASAASIVVSSRVRDGFIVLASRQKPAPFAPPIEQRVHDLAGALEMVKASEAELRLPPLARLAQVIPESPPPSVGGALDAAAAAKKEMEQKRDESRKAAESAEAGGSPGSPPPSSEGATPEAKAGVAKEPPPPPKRSGEERKPSGGVAAVGRMKQLITSITGMPPNPAEGGLVTVPEQVDAQAVPAEFKQESKKKSDAKTVAPVEEPPPFVGDPMEQIVSIDLREMDLTNVVALLAQKAQINVIAGTELKGVVTANLRNITLRKAIDTVLRMNNLGVVQEEGIYRIVSYEEAVASKRKTLMVKLESAKVEDLQKTLQDVIKGTPEDNLISISTDKQTNTLILAGPELRVAELEKLARELDIAKPATPTVTEAIKINNSEPDSLLPLVMAMKSKDIGNAAVDVRSRTLVITDIPVVIEQ
ncbi:MAG: AMIN domain-containing protein, partial [Candidatus Hydrogenedentes bacterium]|nr:AMIN domain-containing protein [Candidatus Hydrogenedentota bacterium]